MTVISPCLVFPSDIGLKGPDVVLRLSQTHCDMCYRLHKAGGTG